MIEVAAAGSSAPDRRRGGVRPNDDGTATSTCRRAPPRGPPAPADGTPRPPDRARPGPPPPSRTTPPRPAAPTADAFSAAWTSSGIARSWSPAAARWRATTPIAVRPSIVSRRSATRAWRPPPGAAEQAPVRGVVDQRVGEPPAVGRRRSGRSARRRPGARRSRDRPARRGPRRRSAPRTVMPIDRRDPEHRPRLARQSASIRRPEQRPQRHRQARPDRAAVVGQPSVRRRRGRRLDAHRPPPADDRPDRLADEQRVAGRPLRGAAGRRTGPAPRRRRPPRSSPVSGSSRPTRRRRSMPASVGVGGRRAGPASPNTIASGRVGGDADDLVDHAGARRVEPVEVVDDDQARTVETR